MTAIEKTRRTARASISAVLRKELRQYGASGVPYAVVAGFLLPAAVWFFWFYDFVGLDQASLRGYFAAFPVLYIVLLPAVTMRLWVEERRSGTLELLRSAPVGDRAIVVGKFLGALTVVVLMLALTLFVPLTVTRLGAFDLGEIVAEYIGALLLAGASLALVMLVSVRLRSQVTAYLAGVLTLFALNAAHQLAAFAPVPRSAERLLRAVSLEYQFRGFTRGVLDTGAVGYYLVLVVLALFLCERQLARAAE